MDRFRSLYARPDLIRALRHYAYWIRPVIANHQHLPFRDLAFLPSTKPTTLDRSIFIIRLAFHTISPFLQHCLLCASHAAFCSLRLFRQSTDAPSPGNSTSRSNDACARGCVIVSRALTPFTSFHLPCWLSRDTMYSTSIHYRISHI
jgi:hypothetical protein